MNTRWGGSWTRSTASTHNSSASARARPSSRIRSSDLLEVAYHAVEDAGLSHGPGREAGGRIRRHLQLGLQLPQLNSESRAAIDAYTNVGSSLCIAANRISYFFNLVGPSLSVDTACSSSLVATHLAAAASGTEKASSRSSAA